jgi:hypothetical protein
VKPNVGSAIQSVTSDNNQAQSNSQFVNTNTSYGGARQMGQGGGAGGDDDVVYLSELNWVSFFHLSLKRNATNTKVSSVVDQ